MDSEEVVNAFFSLSVGALTTALVAIWLWLVKTNGGSFLEFLKRSERKISGLIVARPVILSMIVVVLGLCVETLVAADHSTISIMATTFVGTQSERRVKALFSPMEEEDMGWIQKLKKMAIEFYRLTFDETIYMRGNPIPWMLTPQGIELFRHKDYLTNIVPSNFVQDPAGMISKSDRADQRRAIENINKIYRHARHWCLAQDNYFTLLERSERRIQWASSSAFVLLWFILFSVLSYGLRVVGVLNVAVVVIVGVFTGVMGVITVVLVGVPLYKLGVIKVSRGKGRMPLHKRLSIRKGREAWERKWLSIRNRLSRRARWFMPKNLACSRWWPSLLAASFFYALIGFSYVKLEKRQIRTTYHQFLSHLDHARIGIETKKR